MAIAAISSFTAHAKNDPTTAYMFGFASSFSDSTVYMTSVQRVDSVYLTRQEALPGQQRELLPAAEGIPGVDRCTKKNLHRDLRPQLQEGGEEMVQAARPLHQAGEGKAPEERREAEGPPYSMADEEHRREQVHVQGGRAKRHGGAKDQG